MRLAATSRRDMQGQLLQRLGFVAWRLGVLARHVRLHVLLQRESAAELLPWRVPTEVKGICTSAYPEMAWKPDPVT